MAEDNGGNGQNLNYFGNKGKNKESETEDTGDEAEEPSLDLDIGLGNSNQAKYRNIGAEGSPSAGYSNESSNREEIPFSLKHFLNRDVSYGGARPKVNPTPTPPPDPAPWLMPNFEATSGLPDFVKDHLVIEQCYLNSGSPQEHLAVDLDSISNFSKFSEHNYAADFPLGQDFPFDLTAPPDLGQQQEVGTSKSLPDFLSDGPIRNERGQPTASPSISPERRPPSFQNENDRLRRELDVLRRQLSDHIVRNERLETELTLLRNRSGLEGLKEQLEENMKRADEAEGRASKLKAENNALRCELEVFRCARGRGGENSAASSSAQQTDNERLASQLRNAANTAELSLRHLLIGVDNLRLLAASLETQPQQPVGRKLSSSDDSQDDEPGPAL